MQSWYGADVDYVTSLHDELEKLAIRHVKLKLGAVERGTSAGSRLGFEPFFCQSLILNLAQLAQACPPIIG